ncbi:hypothetical protein BFR04_08860 [Gaetbulibacter sp. 4G1]|nr:glycosyltransferase family 4 protein [Gaetbulibacter sp. 4G1]PIA77539.1 hypothetical protein BFR04_08860 [Gaetbulibacter sp. 4G1]
MKLLYVTNGINGSGGLERVLSIKVNYLVKHFNYEIHILRLNEEKLDPFYQFCSSIVFHNINATGNLIQSFLRYKKGLKKNIVDINPDVISVCDDGLKGLFVPYIIGKYCPIIYERHASKSIFKNNKTSRYSMQSLKLKLYDVLMHIGAKKYDAFVVLTNTNLTEWKLKNITVIPNPLSFYPEEKAKLTNKKVIMVGNHGYQKGIDRLLHAWKLIIVKHPNWKLEIYGKIHPEKLYHTLAQELGIAANVSFFDPVQNIGDKYKTASIYAMSSRSEGFGMVLIEAMSYGVPCVSYNCPSGPIDIISDGEDGFLIKDGYIDDFKDAICYLIEDLKIREKMGTKALLKAKKYAPELIIPQWDILFKSLTR